MKEDTIDILHHNRSRSKLIDLITDYIERIMSVDAASTLFHFDIMFNRITPDNESQVVIDNYKQYINSEIAENDESCIYTMRDSKNVIDSLIEDFANTSAMNNPFLKKWLNNRGVSDDQIIRHKLIDLRYIADYDEHDRNATGATIHPALRGWITEAEAPDWIPNGVMIPVRDLNGNIIGCHNRFLSTVPKIKFASSIPNFHLFTNLRNNTTFKRIFIVEGSFDALAIETADPEAGWIAPSTGYWTAEQLINLVHVLDTFRHSEIISCFDNDLVGLKSNLLLTHALGMIKFNVSIMTFPKPAKDPAEAIFKYGMKIDDIEKREYKSALIEYAQAPREPLKKFEDYMNNRHASYSIENYRWNGVQ